MGKKGRLNAEDQKAADKSMSAQLNSNVETGIPKSESGREATDEELEAAGLDPVNDAGADLLDEPEPDAPGDDTPDIDAPAIDPVEASVIAAGEMIAGGATPEYAADWLARNHPEAFTDAADAADRIKARGE